MNLKALETAAEKGELYRSGVKPLGKELLVFVHGFRKTPMDHIGMLTALAQDKDLQRYDILPFRFPAGMFSNREPQEIAEELSDLIDVLHRSISTSASTSWRTVWVDSSLVPL
jgi:hypothetical protein